MKNNRRNRNVTFIRQKNNLRLGKRPFKCVFKLSNDLRKYPEDYQTIVESCISETEQSLLKIFKLKLRNNLIEFGTIDDDFVNNDHRMRVELKN